MNNNQLQIIDEREVLGKQLRIYGDFENPLFLAKDIAEWIDYAKTGNGSYDVNKMLKTVDENEKLIRKIFASGQNREMWFVTEDGLYEVLMQSTKPIAKEFKKN
ncbi:Bro-N domain-containing protein [Fusobacterium polymorphum]|uniref:BRO-N domain-containing protein n=1 Tax=Fusobacterium nucleatum subsp. polymorphum TaxID=76857 RepID=UPI0030085ED6